MLNRYEQSLDHLVGVLRQVPGDRWDAATRCEQWTARDVVGHTIWGQLLLHAHAADGDPPSYAYGPGREAPGEYAGDDPLSAWEAIRAEGVAILDSEALDREFEGRYGPMTIGALVGILTIDNFIHSWDLGPVAGVDVVLEDSLVTEIEQWADGVIAASGVPGYFAAPLQPPEGADAQTRMLARLGRQAW